METCYDPGPGASSAKCKYVLEFISKYGKGDRDKFFGVLEVSKDLQQARRAYEVVFDPTSGVREPEVIKPIQQTATKLR